MKKKNGISLDDGIVPLDDETSPLSLFSVLLSLASMANAQARWLVGLSRELSEYGGYSAATDMQIVADFLIAGCEEFQEEWQQIEIKMPRGFAHEPWATRATPPEEKGDLPF